MEGGAQLFLAAAETLQHTLLPHLSAVDLFRLATTSKAIQEWLLSTPRHLWQVSLFADSHHPRFVKLACSCSQGLFVQRLPGDASPAYLARLQTTKHLLTAMRKACEATSRIRSGQQPVAQQVLPLTGLSSVPLKQGHRWLPVTCTQLTLSACGGWLAACLEAEQAPHQQPSVFGLERLFYEVAIYRVAGLRVQNRLACGTSAANLQWSPDAADLSIALRPFPRDQGADSVAPGIPAACIVDAETGAVLSSLSERTCEAVLALTMHPGSDATSVNGQAHELQWSRSGRKIMLVQQTYVAGEGTDSAGWLRIFDVPEDRMVLETHYVCEQDEVPGVWHPSSRGIVLVSESSVQEPGAFERARLALGCLPAYPLRRMADPGSSADGKLYCVKVGGESVQEYRLLRCSLQEQGIVFSPLHQITGWCFQWASAGSLAVLQQALSGGTQCAGATTCIRDMGTLELHCSLGAQPSYKNRQLPNLSFSPSQQLVGFGGSVPCIWCAHTGKKLWSVPASPEDRLNELRQHAGLLTGPPWPYWAVHWLPSGRGLILLAISWKCAACLHIYLFS